MSSDNTVGVDGGRRIRLLCPPMESFGHSGNLMAKAALAKELSYVLCGDQGVPPPRPPAGSHPHPNLEADHPEADQQAMLICDYSLYHSTV